MVPFLAMIFDYLENMCIVFMITNSDEVSESVIYLSNFFTISKGVLTSIAWMGILLYSLRWGRMKIMDKKNNYSPTKLKLH
jgi:hypothetical protein